MKFDTAMKAMLDSAMQKENGRIVIYGTGDTKRCNQLKDVGMAEFRYNQWFLTEKARKILRVAK